MKKIETITDLREDLIEVYEKLRANKIGLREAKERNNTAGKIINTAKTQLEYNIYTKSHQKIKFLEVNT